MDKEAIKSEVEKIIDELKKLTHGRSVHDLIKEEVGESQYLLSKTFALIDKITGINKYHLTEISNCIQNSKRQGGIAVQNLQQLIGQLMFIKDGLENNWITKLQYEIEGNEMLEFLNHSIRYCEENRKIEGSIISSAIFEDTIRKIGKKNDIENRSLEQVLNGLKATGVFSKVFVEKLKYYLAVRNRSLHASWHEFEIDDIKQLNLDLENLIKDYIIE